MTARTQLAKIGLHLPHILLPAPGVDPMRFAVNACDQFTSQPEYWQETEAIVGTAPSTLRLILPEVYLGQNDEERIAAINRTMEQYLTEGTLQDIGEAAVYVRRQTSGGSRSGLVIAVDLELYDFRPQAKSPIRATEATVEGRLPIRINVRRQAVLESPHIMLLYNDPANSLNEMLAASNTGRPLLYDFDLMQQGGHISGWKIDREDDLNRIAELLAATAAPDGFIFAVGDGNHSLATAKCCWEEIKPTLSPAEQAGHPARYALVELINLFDPALHFEPIHRILLNVDPAAVQRDLSFDAEDPPSMQILQPQLDAWMAKHPEVGIDYIHGAEDTRRLGAAPDRLAIVWDHFPKDTLFQVIERDGCFVRKSFSMGQARDKRYYLECQAIR